MVRPARLFLLLATAASLHAQPVHVAVDLTGRDLAGASVGARGDTVPLAWDRSLSLTDPDGDGVYSAEVAFPEGTGVVAYKTVIEPASGEVQWEPGPNRLLLPGRMAEDRRAFGAPQTDLPLLSVSQGQLAEDLTVLRETMTALHPGLTLHNTEADLQAIDGRLTRQARALGRRYGEAIPMTAAYLPIAQAVAAIRDGHTQVSMYNQSGYTDAVLYTRPDRVPFTFRLIDGRMIVTGDATPNGALPPGTEILSLDGRPVLEVIEAMMPYASADGGNDAKRVHELEVNGLPAPAERFDVLYSLLYEPEGFLALTVRSPEGTVSDPTVRRMSQDDRRAALLVQDPTRPQSTDDLLQFRILDDGTGYLKVGSFATFSMERDYDAWLTDAFRQMAEAGTERLVVDLRGCAGGMDDAAAFLLRHLITAPVQLSSWQGITAFDRVPESLRPTIRSWSDDFYDLSSRVTPVGDGTFQMPTRAPVDLPPAPDAFQGRVAVLVDVAASSATFYLAQRIQETGAAPLVGQTTGGSLKGLNAGQLVFLTLPNTGIVVDVPLFGSRPLTPGPDRGVIPDVLVEPDAEAAIAGRDSEMDAALALLHAPTEAGQ